MSQKLGSVKAIHHPTLLTPSGFGHQEYVLLWASIYGLLCSVWVGQVDETIISTVGCSLLLRMNIPCTTTYP